MRILFVSEMTGTINALDPALKVLREQHGCEFRFAAADQARKTLEKRGIELVPEGADPTEVIREFKPDLVLVGIAAPIAGKPPPTIESTFALAAMNAGISVAMYRDYGGLAPWAQALTMCPKSAKLLTFLFESSKTLKLVEGKSLRDTRVVGSGYYDADATRDWAEVRKTSRAAISIAEDAIVIFVNNAADHVRALEMMNPVADAFEDISTDLVLVPSFHPKDPDAPFGEKSKKDKRLVARPSKPYDPVLDRLSGNRRIRVIREPEFRNIVADSKARIAAADLVVMNPQSTETISTALAGIPQIICALPHTAADCATKGINVNELRVVEERCADVVHTATGLVTYLHSIPRMLPDIRKRLLPGCRALREEMAKPATPAIAAAILDAAKAC